MATRSALTLGGSEPELDIQDVFGIGNWPAGYLVYDFNIPASYSDALETTPTIGDNHDALESFQPSTGTSRVVFAFTNLLESLT